MNSELPNCDRAQVANAKLFRYLLNPEHPDGKSKAQFFALIGYNSAPNGVGNGEDLRTALLMLACTGTVTNVLPNRGGVKYVVVGPINAPNGKTYQLLTVWAVELPDNLPRLVTAYPS